MVRKRATPMALEVDHESASSQQPRIWLLAAFGDERQYAGNAGYADILRSEYKYDSQVPNHLQLSSGDVVVLRGRDKMLGVARIERIEAEAGLKTQGRCPVAGCGTTGIKIRTTKHPQYRCSNKHEFDEPLISEARVVKKTAYFGSSFVTALEAVSVSELRAACERPAAQLAIQQLSSAQLGARIAGIVLLALSRLTERQG
jgi:putative restriction endonuclease